MLEGVQGLGVLLLLIGMGTSAWLSFQDLRRRNARLKRKVTDLEQTIQRQEERYATFYHAVDSVTREQAKARLAIRQPFENRLAVARGAQGRVHFEIRVVGRPGRQLPN